MSVSPVPGPTDIRVVESKNVPRGSRYATFNHCWGVHRARLTKELLPSFKEQISSRALTKTFLDASQVMRALNIEYVWIDSLCIVQDSEEDRRREAFIMWEVYTNSYLHLSATASRESSKGLFRSRHPGTTSLCIATVGEDHPLLKE